MADSVSCIRSPQSGGSDPVACDNRPGHFNFSLAHLNARSIMNKFDHISDFISDRHFSAVAVTETWLTPSQTPFIQGYHFYSQPRLGRAGGGVGVFIEDAHSHHRIHTNLNFLNFEHLTVRLSSKKNKGSILLSVIYRPPQSDPSQFIDELSGFLSSVSHPNETIFIAGDFNINLLRPSKLVTSFLNTFASYFLFPKINQPTRMSSSSNTLIDNIFTNDPDNCIADVMYEDISDHLPICISHYLPFVPKLVPPEVARKRNITKGSQKRFWDALVAADWSEYLTCDKQRDVNELFNSFLDRYQSIYDSCFLITENVPRTRVFKKPWMSQKLLALSVKKKKLYKAYRLFPSVANTLAYNHCRDTFSSLKSAAMKTYFADKFIRFQNDRRRTWTTINQALNKNSRSSPLPKEFSLEGHQFDEPASIANEFNKYFSSIGERLAKTFDFVSSGSGGRRESTARSGLLCFKPVSEQDILTIVTELNHSNAIDHHGLQAKAVLLSVPFIVKPLTTLINLVLSTGVFPNILKIARITPILKSGDPTIISNYRPISILPIFSKIFEKVIYIQTYQHLEDHNLLYQHQYGFRRNHSTSQALLQMQSLILNSFEEYNFSIGIFLDVAKAFDSLDHDILLNKLPWYGFNELAVALIRSYLQDRQQSVAFKGITSEMIQVTCGVPQGSILGPLLFNIFMNDLHLATNLLKTILFADDTNIFGSAKSLEDLYSLANSELTRVATWFSSNKLVLNTSKTHHVLFIGNKKLPNSIPPLTLNGELIPRVSSTKFLGVHIDQSLNWSYHIDYILKKVSINIGVISRVRHLLPRHVARTLYFALIHPYITYCSIVWMTASPTSLKPLQVLQNRAIRVISHLPPRSNCEEALRCLGILTIPNIFLLQIGSFMFTLRNSGHPPSITSLINFSSNTHPCSMRRPRAFEPAFTRKKKCFRSLPSAGPRLWSGLPLDVTASTTLPVFKKRLKSFLQHHAQPLI